MSEQRLLTETTKSPEKKSGNRWMVTVATPGQGSSGFYSEDLLREQGPAALHPGAHSFINHDASRSPKDLIGVFKEGAFWDEESKSLKAELSVFDRWGDFVNEVAPYVGMSLYMHGELDEDGNVVTLTPNATNGCDLVARPGLDGSGLDERLYESALARAKFEFREEKKDMDMKEVVEQLEALTKAVTPLVEAHAAEVEAREAHDDEKTAVERYDAAVKAIDAADLLPAQVEDLRARALKGEDIVEAIESAKAIKKDAISQVESEQKQQESANAGRLLSGVKVESALDFGKVLG